MLRAQSESPLDVLRSATLVGAEVVGLAGKAGELVPGAFARARVTGSQDFEPDPRNETVVVYVNGELVPRSEAVVSVFDAGFSLGDGVWESFRLHHGQFPFADAHLDRLFRGASAIRLDIGMTREEIAPRCGRRSSPTSWSTASTSG